MAEFKTILDMELAKKEAFIAELKAENKEMIAEKVLSLTEFLNKIYENKLAQQEASLLTKIEGQSHCRAC